MRSGQLLANPRFYLRGVEATHLRRIAEKSPANENEPSHQHFHLPDSQAS